MWVTFEVITHVSELGKNARYQYGQRKRRTPLKQTLRLNSKLERCHCARSKADKKSSIFFFLGSGQDRRQSPVEWGDFPSVRSSVRPFVRPSVRPPHEGPRASQPGLRPSKAVLRASQSGLRASQAGLGASEAWLAGSEAWLAGS